MAAFVRLVVGLILVTAPGVWLFRLVPRPHGQTRSVLEPFSRVTTSTS